MSNPLILLEGVTFGYSRRPILEGLNLQVEPGSLMGLFGPNGSGKTTLMRILAGIMPPQKGKVSVCGLDPFRDRARICQKVTAVMEKPSSYPWMTTNQFLAFYGRMAPGWDEKYVRDRLGEYQIPGVARLGSLSCGQRGLLSLFCAIGRRSPVLLFDDPTLGLDVAARRNLYRTLVEEMATRELTILYCSHLPAEVEGLITHAAFLRDRRITAAGTIEDLKRSFPGREDIPSMEEMAVHFCAPQGTTWSASE